MNKSCLDIKQLNVHFWDIPKFEKCLCPGIKMKFKHNQCLAVIWQALFLWLSQQLLREPSSAFYCLCDTLSKKINLNLIFGKDDIYLLCCFHASRTFPTDYSWQRKAILVVHPYWKTFGVQCHEILFSFFLHGFNSPGPLINRLKWFCWKIRFHGDIQI